MTISEVPRLRVLVAVRRRYVSNLFNLCIETRRDSVFCRPRFERPIDLLATQDVTLKSEQKTSEVLFADVWTDGGRLTFVSTLLQLAVVRSLLDKVQQVLGQGLVGDGPGWVEKNSSAQVRKSNQVEWHTHRHWALLLQA